MPSQPKQGAAFFYLDDNGKRQDADLHNPILAAGDDVAALAVSVPLMRQLGLTEQEIASITPIPIDHDVLAKLRAKRATQVGKAERDWDESEHPRDEDGKFTVGGGSGGDGENESDDTAKSESDDTGTKIIHRSTLPYSDTPEEKYIRFGNLPASGKSTVGQAPNPLAVLTGEAIPGTELAGISVIPLVVNKERNLWEIDSSELTEGGFASVDELISNQLNYEKHTGGGHGVDADGKPTWSPPTYEWVENIHKRPIYLVTGEDTGEEGTDGEPLLADVKILDKLNVWDIIHPGYFDPDEDLYPEEAPEAFGLTFAKATAKKNWRDWDESEHPRDEDGKFTVGGGGGGGGGGADSEGGGGEKVGAEIGHGYSKDAVLKADGKIHTSNVYDAARALYEDRPVVLKQPRTVSVLIDHLGQVTKHLTAMGAKAPNFNLCNVSVAGTNLFCAQSIGIPRPMMPQFDDKQTKEFRKYLAAKGYKVEKTTARSDYLRATQNELNGAKVARIAATLRNSEAEKLKRIVVSEDNYILDGHHHWAAQVGNDAADNKLGDAETKIARVNIDVITLLQEARLFAGKELAAPASKPALKLTPEEVKRLEGRARLLAKNHDFNPRNVHVANSSKRTKLGSRYFETAASYNMGTGEITVYSNMADLPLHALDSVMAHETTHHKFHVVERNYWKDFHKSAKAGVELSAPLSAADKEKYPTLALMIKYFDIDDEQLAKDDGFTGYSRDWWRETRKGNDSDIHAVNETLAEIAAHGMKKGDSSEQIKDVTPLWRAFYNDLNKAYAKLGGVKAKMPKENPDDYFQ